jgi:hypothetical protein
MWRGFEQNISDQGAKHFGSYRFVSTVFCQGFQMALDVEKRREIDAIGQQRGMVIVADLISLTVGACPAFKYPAVLQVRNPTAQCALVDAIAAINQNPVGCKDDHLVRSRLRGYERQQTPQDRDVAITKLQTLAAGLCQIKDVPTLVLVGCRGLRRRFQRRQIRAPDMPRHGRGCDLFHDLFTRNVQGCPNEDRFAQFSAGVLGLLFR